MSSFFPKKKNPVHKIQKLMSGKSEAESKAAKTERVAVRDADWGKLGSLAFADFARLCEQSHFLHLVLSNIRRSEKNRKGEVLTKRLVARLVTFEIFQLKKLFFRWSKR